MSHVIEICRNTLAGAGTFSDFFWDGRRLFWYCERTEVLIPAGEYELLPHKSAKPCLSTWGGLTVAFHNPALAVYAEQSMIPAGVHGARFDCLIHPFNWPFESDGCGAPGLTITEIAPNGWGVANSRKAFAQLVQLWGDRSGLRAIIKEMRS